MTPFPEIMDPPLSTALEAQKMTYWPISSYIAKENI